MDQSLRQKSNNFLLENEFELPSEIIVLGKTYQIYYLPEEVDKELEDKYGYADQVETKVVIDTSVIDDCKNDKRRALELLKRTLRHEIVHCYFFECGLDDQTPFARNETLIDWLALKLPDIFSNMKQKGLL